MAASASSSSAPAPLVDMFGLSGKLALVTGATLGIGNAIATKFAAAGATVLVNGRNAERAEAAAKAINDLGVSGKAISVAADLSKAEGMEPIEAAVKAAGQPLDILVCNVGIFAAEPFETTSDEAWQRYFDVNIMSTVRPCRTFLPEMIKRDDGGRVIIVSSEASMKPLPHMVAYSATKGMQVNIARGLAETTKGTSVTVNSLLPGPTATEGVKEYFAGMAKQQGRSAEDVTASYFKDEEPASLKQRLLHPDEVSNAALYLASKASSGTNGSSMRVEGGLYRSI